MKTWAPTAQATWCAAARSARAVSDVIEIIVMLGEPERAEHILDFYCAAAGVGRWSRPSALTERRHRALIAAVSGDPWGALTIVEEGLTEEDVETGSPEEAGRSLLIRGGLRMMHGRRAAARADLGRAVDILSAHGVVRWCDAALRALVSTAQPERWRSFAGDTEVRAAMLTGWYWDHGEIAAGLRRALAEVEAELTALPFVPSA